MTQTYGMCANYKGGCPSFERAVPAVEGDTCGDCGHLLLHSSGLTWADARAERSGGEALMPTTPKEPLFVNPEPGESLAGLVRSLLIDSKINGLHHKVTGSEESLELSIFKADGEASVEATVKISVRSRGRDPIRLEFGVPEMVVQGSGGGSVTHRFQGPRG